MENTFSAVKHNGVALFLCILLQMGTSLAAETELGTDPPMTQAITPTCETPSYNPTHSTPLLVSYPKKPSTVCYDISDDSNSECLKTQMGVQYMVTAKKNMMYFNIEPSSTRVTGQCGQNTSNLSLNFTGGHLDFTFHKKEDVSYVTAVRASLEASTCKGCKQELFKGEMTDTTLFKARAGLCYKCYTQTTLQLAENLRIKIINAQIQAFGITDKKFGPEVECWPDYYRRVVPIILGGVAMGICLMATLTYLLIRDNYPQGYERI